MRHAVETLESRLLLSSGGMNVSGLASSLVADPANGMIAIILQREQEPNGTLDQANAISLQPEINCSRICPLVNSSPGIATATATGLPIRWWLDRRLQAFVEGDLSDAAGDKDTDDFSFSVDSQSRIQLSFVGPALTDGVLPQLLDANGNVLATAGPDNKNDIGAANVATINYFTSSGGKFYIQVGPGSDSNGDGSSQYDMHVVVSTDTHVEHEPNNEFATANPIELQSNPWQCNVVCPLDATGGENPATGVSRPDQAGAIFPLPIGEIATSHGFVQGELLPVGCPACEIAVAPDVDFFSFELPADQRVHIELLGGLAHSGGQLTLFDVDHNQLAADTDSSNGLALDMPVPTGGTFFVQVDRNLIVPPTGDTSFCSHGAAIAAACADPHPTQYTLTVTAKPITNPIQGPDETEPNDTLDQANVLELHDLPTVACSISFRGGGAHGIAGGLTDDQDAWKFDIQAAEHVTVAAVGLVTGAGGGIYPSIDDWIIAQHLNQFGDPVGTVYAGGTPLFSEVTGKLTDRLTYILQHHPELSLAPMQVVVYDADKHEIGRAIGNTTVPNAVHFDATAGGTYYALVSVASGSSTADPIHYRLGVLARDPFLHSQPDPIVSVLPQVIVLNSGGIFDYTDSSGDKVHIVYRGAGGHAAITFTDSSADGSDIASVVIDGARRGGNLSIQTSGSAEVGSVEVHGVHRGRRILGGFGNVQVDGNVGSFSSEVNLRSVAVDGLLGQIETHSRQIASVTAAVIDSAMADVGSIRSLHVDEDFTAAIFHRFLPWEEQP